MNTEQLRDALHEALGDEADRFGAGHPIGLADVKSSARTIRRRRRAVVLGAAAAVAVIAVPVAINAASSENGSRPPIATQTPSPSEAVPSPDAPVNVKLTLADASRGMAPAIPWLKGRTLHAADGSIAKLPADYLDVASYRGGWLGILSSNDGYTVDTLDANGAVTDSAPSSDGFAISTDQTRIAWIDGNRLTVADPRPDATSEPQTIGLDPGLGGFQFGGFVGGSVAYTGGSATDRPASYVTDLTDTTSLPGARLVGGTSSATDRIAVQTSISDNGSCWEVRTYPAGTVDWQTCKFSLGGFSADGRYVIGRPAYLDGFGDSEVAILDASDGSVLRRWRTAPNSAILGSAFEETSHGLISVVYDDGAWHLARLNLGGEVEDTVDPVKDNDPYTNGSPFTLPSQP